MKGTSQNEEEVNRMTKESAMNLAEALPLEMARVRDEVLPQYIAMRGMPRINVEPAIFMMRHELDAAAKAMAEGDVVAMLRSYQSLKETST